LSFAEILKIETTGSRRLSMRESPANGCFSISAVPIRLRNETSTFDRTYRED